MLETIIKQMINSRWIVMIGALSICAFGVWNFQNLSIDAVPDITNVQVQINTEAPGYSPLESEQRITFPIETTLAGLPQLSYTRSLSAYGLSQVTVVFEEGTDIYFARNLVNSRLSAIKNQLPANLEPEMGPISSGLGEIFMYTVSAEAGALQSNGEPYDLFALREIQDWIIKRQLILVDGVTEVNTSGGFEKQYHVKPDPAKMLLWGITLPELLSALRDNNINQGAGYIERNGQQLMVRSPGQLKTIADIEQVSILSRNSIPVRVKDVAEVSIGKELRTGAGTHSGQEAVIGTAFMLLGENSRTVAREVAAKLEEINTTLPDGVVAEPLYDRTVLVDNAIATVEENLVVGALLVVVVLFLLLGNIRAALITATVIPISMLATISGMVEVGVSANLMSLGALDFGIIVDGAVIIVENSIRRLGMATHGSKVLSLKARLQVVYEATNEVIRPSLFGVAIITLVYIPIFSLTGIEGKMFHPMAFTVIIALLSAMVLSLTFVPAAVALFITGKVSEKKNPIMKGAEWLYKPVLQASLQFRWMVVVFALSTIGGAGWLATTMGSEFIPQLDEGDVTVQALRPPGTSLQQSIEMQDILERRLLDFPEVQDVFSRIGTPEIASDPMPPSISDTFVILKDRSEWPDPFREKRTLLEEWGETLEELPGQIYEVTQPIQMRFNELISGVRSDLGIMVFGEDLDQLGITAQEILDIVEGIEGAADARIEQTAGLPMLTLTPKRDVLARYGLSVKDAQHVISTAIGGESVGLIYEGDRRFPLVVRLPEEMRLDMDRIGRLPIPVPTTANETGYVLLSEVVKTELLSSPNRISRENGQRRVVVSANVRGRDLGSFVAEVREAITSQVDIPPGYFVEYGGTFEQLESASQRLSLVVPATLTLIFGLLIIVLGSFRDSLIIFTGVPLALTGGVLALYIREMPLSITAGVGFIALSGIAVLNGLVMLSFIKAMWQETGELIPSIIDGAMTRLRPVLMTALVASLGFIPMALNTGIGAEVQRPLATVVIGGIISSTLLTLVLLPALFLIVNKNRRLVTE